VVNIEQTTLVCADCQSPALAARALSLTLAQCGYPRAVFFTDAAEVPGLDAGVERVAIPTIASALDYSRFVLKELVRHVDTAFVQVVQWDGYVTRGAAWDPEFQRYDYVGARWWFRQEGRNVGNGGFSLRSRRLLEALQDPEIQVAEAEDDVICLQHRDLLERRHGIRIAPSIVADAYAFEGAPPSGREFGFHRVFNFPHFHDEAKLAQVMAQVPESVYCGEVAVSLVKKLLWLGRGDEALRYAAMALGKPALPPAWRGHIERLVKAEEKRRRRISRRVAAT
jgi:uncharacterized protein DUF5672